MVIGSQLQVSKLAQMAPSSAQRRSVAASSAQRWPAATRVKTRAKNQMEPSLKKTRIKTWVKTWMEHLGAPLCPFRIRRVKTSSHFHQTGI